MAYTLHLSVRNVAACRTSLCDASQTERRRVRAGGPLSQVVGQDGSAAGVKPAAAPAGPAARPRDHDPAAVTLGGCLHRFVRPESLGAHDRWICTRRAHALRVGCGTRVSGAGSQLRQVRMISLMLERLRRAVWLHSAACSRPRSTGWCRGGACAPRTCSNSAGCWRGWLPGCARSARTGLQPGAEDVKACSGAAYAHALLMLSIPCVGFKLVR